MRGNGLDAPPDPTRAPPVATAGPPGTISQRVATSDTRHRPRRQDAMATVHPAAPLKPLAALAWGMLIVVIDVRFEKLDVLPDPFGWAFAAVAVGKLAGLHRGYLVAAVACVVAVLPSLPSWVGVQHPLITFAEAVAMSVLVFAVCTALIATAPAHRNAANAIRWVDLGAGVSLLVLTALADADPSFAAALTPLAVVVALVMVAAFVWFLVLAFQVAKTASVPVQTSPRF